jgi:hypothetical protein
MEPLLPKQGNTHVNYFMIYDQVNSFNHNYKGKLIINQRKLLGKVCKKRETTSSNGHAQILEKLNKTHLPINHQKIMNYIN